MPTVYQNRTRGGKPLVNEHYLKNRGWLSENTPLLWVSSSNPDIRYYVEIFSEYYACMLDIDYLKQHKVISPERYDERFCLYQETIKKLILEYPRVCEIDFFERVIAPKAWDNADMYFNEIVKMHNEKYLTNCPCGQTFIARKKKTKYCDACKKKVPVQNYRERNKRTIGKKVCKCCLKSFTPKRETGIFCSDKCRVYWNRKKIISSL